MSMSVQTKRTIAGALAIGATVVGLSVGPSIASAGTASQSMSKASTTSSFAQIRCYGGVTDGTIVTWYGAPVSVGQPVVASAVEAGGGNPTQEFFGAYRIYAEGTAVKDNAVQVKIHTGAAAPTDICVHYVG
ncbi:hypothetical protein [Amycolatopsis regifaucium]|uniref:Ig-like domain-containing protein n=1 Tax=Amycolatopsis regifaucium TaxID=546365 RepID=A0A154MF89_9PSEU|nr:hypothetical protein [Amycolatopsis regifaucium]KZB83171.1 hypothetical protein AVL48_36765 [Amycolatopsis regifaucium]OKA03177.1 hypothetical protein ATP06_0237235 [Amycolatopsis regifaucium]SFJ48298.1 hypothetical protein SAMN04489731_12273 [Amycolatopsis regifaucium]